MKTLNLFYIYPSFSSFLFLFQTINCLMKLFVSFSNKMLISSLSDKIFSLEGEAEPHNHEWEPESDRVMEEPESGSDM